MTTEVLTWPYPTVREDWDAGSPQWREITEDAYDEMLNVLPPLRMSGRGFVSSEPYYHTDEGKGVYLGCKVEGDRYYARLLTVEQWDKRQV